MPCNPESQGVKRIVRPAPRSEPVAEPEKLRLVNRRQDYIHYRLLDDLVLQGSDAGFILHLLQDGFRILVRPSDS